MAALELNPCAKTILCGFAPSVQDALVGLLNVALAPLHAKKAVLLVQIQQYDIALVIPLTLKDVLEQTMAVANSASSFIPHAALKGCNLPLGETLRDAINTGNDVVAEAGIVLDEIARLVSAKTYIQTVLAIINEWIVWFEDIIDLLLGCSDVNT